MESYKGLHIGCAPGTHAKLVELLERARANKSGGTLDFGAHSGALLQRLADLGHTELHAADLDTTVFRLEGVPHFYADLNVAFSHAFNRRFSVITCTDVIEHLDSPRAFLTEVRHLLADDGVLGLTFPNVAFWEGRVKFLLKGELWGFGRRNYVAQRHISPLTREQLDLMLRELGYAPIAIESGGSFATTLRTLVFAPLWIVIRAVGGPMALGESVVMVAARAEMKADLKRPTDYNIRWDESARAASAKSTQSN